MFAFLKNENSGGVENYAYNVNTAHKVNFFKKEEQHIGKVNKHRTRRKQHKGHIAF